MPRLGKSKALALTLSQRIVMRIFGFLLLAAAFTTGAKAHADEPDIFIFSASLNITVCESNGRVDTCAVPISKPTKVQLGLVGCITQEDETICSGIYHMNRNQDGVSFDGFMKAQATHHADGSVDYVFTANLASPQLPDLSRISHSG